MIDWEVYMYERKIQLAANNYDKKNTYMHLLSRYKLAIKHEFYFEALLIDYAFIEDRLFSYLYYIGAVERHDSTKYSKKTRRYLVDIISMVTGRKKVTLSLKNITGKMDVVEATLRWADEVDVIDNDYYEVLKREILGVDIGGMLEILKKIKGWLEFRNEIVHAAMKKSMDDMNEKIMQVVLDGMDYGRYLDNQVKTLKRRNIVRRKMRMGHQ